MYEFKEAMVCFHISHFLDVDKIENDSMISCLPSAKPRVGILTVDKRSIGFVFIDHNESVASLRNVISDQVRLSLIRPYVISRAWKAHVKSFLISRAVITNAYQYSLKGWCLPMLWGCGFVCLWQSLSGISLKVVSGFDPPSKISLDKSCLIDWLISSTVAFIRICKPAWCTKVSIDLMMCILTKLPSSFD